MRSSIVKIQNISKSFTKNNPVVNNISLSIKPDEIVALLRPSGCGKITTLRLIAGFEYTDSGSIPIQGKIVENGKTHILPQKHGADFVFKTMLKKSIRKVIRSILKNRE